MVKRETVNHTVKKGVRSTGVERGWNMGGTIPGGGTGVKRHATAPRGGTFQGGTEGGTGVERGRNHSRVERGWIRSMRWNVPGWDGVEREWNHSRR